MTHLTDEQIAHYLKKLQEQKNTPVVIDKGSILATVKLGSKDTGKFSGTKKKKSKKASEENVEEGQKY